MSFGVQIENLNFKYSNQIHAIQNLSLKVQENQFLGLLGPNGSGKTTLISLLVGLLKGQGKIEIFGKNKIDKTEIGFCPQDIAFYQTLSAQENLFFFGKLSKISNLETRVNEVIKFIGLEEFKDIPASQYSGGMKRRLNFGISILHRPKLLILDEPTVGVDPQSRNLLFECIENLENMTLIYTSHYMKEVERLCDEVAIMDHGKVLEKGSVEDLCKSGFDQYRFNFERELSVEEASKLQKDLNFQKLEDFILKSRTNPLPLILQFSEATKNPLRKFEHEKYDLEKKFLDLTGRSLRDAL